MGAKKRNKQPGKGNKPALSPTQKPKVKAGNSNYVLIIAAVVFVALALAFGVVSTSQSRKVEEEDFNRVRDLHRQRLMQVPIGDDDVELPTCGLAMVRESVMHGVAFGASVVAKRDFSKGDITALVPSMVVSVENSHRTTLVDYLFGFNKTHNIVAMGIGSIINHSPKPNVAAVFRNWNETANGEQPKYMANEIEVVALRDIHHGEEIFWTYGTEDDMVNWFSERGLTYVDASAGELSQVTPEDGLKVLEHAELPGGCPGIVVKEGRAFAGRSWEQGETIEITRAMLFSQKVVPGEQASVLFWNWRDGPGQLLVLGKSAMMRGAETKRRNERANVWFKWFDIPDANSLDASNGFECNEFTLLAFEAMWPIAKGEELLLQLEDVLMQDGRVTRYAPATFMNICFGTGE